MVEKGDKEQKPGETASSGDEIGVNRRDMGENRKNLWKLRAPEAQQARPFPKQRYAYSGRNSR